MGAGRSGPVQSKAGMAALRPRPRLVQYSQAAAADAVLCTDLCSGHASCAQQAQYNNTYSEMGVLTAVGGSGTRSAERAGLALLLRDSL
jgi:hypothetical protein